MRTKRWMATCVVALLSVAAVLAKDIRVVIFKVSQMHCENCEKKVKNNMRFEKGVKELSTELKNKTVSITYDAEKTDVKKLQAGFKKFNYEAEFVKETKQDGKKDGKQESKKEDKKVYSLFKEYMMMFILIAFSMCLTFMIGIRGFITVWVGKENYILDYFTVVLFTSTSFLNILYFPLVALINADGLFKEDKKADKK